MYASNDYLSKLFQSERHLWVFSRRDLVDWLVLFLARARELEIKVIVDERDRYAEHDFGESFARANTFTSVKRAESERVPRFAVWSHVHFRLGIEAFRVELLGSDPDSRVVLNGLNVNNECRFVRFEVHPANCDVLTEH